MNSSNWKVVVTAGLVGGVAEIVWVMLYGALSPADSAAIAREVTYSVFGAGGGGALAAPIGIALHLLLSLAVAAGFAAMLWTRLERGLGASGVMAGAVASLFAIWTLNFHAVLPMLNPHFIELLPLSVTLASKILFGVGMGAVLVGARPQAVPVKVRSYVRTGFGGSGRN